MSLIAVKTDSLLLRSVPLTPAVYLEEWRRNKTYWIKKIKDAGGKKPTADLRASLSSPSPDPFGERPPIILGPHIEIIDPHGGKGNISPDRGMRKHLAKELQGIKGRLRWMFARTLYQLGMDEANEAHPMIPARSVWLLVGVNGEGIIVDEVVVKCVDTSGNAARARMEDEIAMNVRIKETGCVHILPYFGRGVREIRMRIRNDGVPEGSNEELRHATYIYTAFCRFKDLKALSRLYRDTEDADPIPEHYIWYILRSAVAALSALQKGTCDEEDEEDGAEDDDEDDNDDGDGDRGQGSRTAGKAKGRREADSRDDQGSWERIVHCDIKLGNIFLGDEDERYRSYPRPFLADFDISKMADEIEEDIDDAEYWNVGTEYYKPPVTSPSTLGNSLH